MRQRKPPEKGDGPSKGRPGKRNTFRLLERALRVEAREGIKGEGKERQGYPIGGSNSPPEEKTTNHDQKPPFVRGKSGGGHR